VSVWEPIAGQSGPVRLLQGDVSSGRVSHAYLFSGGTGRVTRAAAEAFAAALVCPDGGCGRCRTCRAVSLGVHPDVDTLEPPGMQLLVEQVRDAVRAAWRVPTEASRRVIVVDRADRMNPNAQNAFLKALEEPPTATTIVLVAPNGDALLETVRSRCREIAFHAPSEGETAEMLVSAGVPDDEARRWARLAGTPDRARQLASDADARARREEVVSLALQPARDPADSLAAAETVAARTREMRDRIAERHRESAAEAAEWLRETKKAVEDRLRREQRRAEQVALDEVLEDLECVLRDALVVAHDRDGPLLDPGLRPVLGEVVSRLGPRAVPAVLRALAAVDLARRRLAANANVLVVLEQVFLAVHGALGSPAPAGATVGGERW